MSTSATVRLAGIRGIIAQKMSEGLAKTAQRSFFADLDASALVATRGRLKDAGKKIGYEDLVLKALTAPPNIRANSVSSSRSDTESTRPISSRASSPAM